MSATGTRPPLFDPEPGGSNGGGFDDEQVGPRQQFPHRRSGSGGPGHPQNRSGSSSSPRWVRPFILGGLVLIAVVSLVSIVSGGGDPGPDPIADPTTLPVDQTDQAAADQAAADQAADDQAADDGETDATGQGDADLEQPATADVVETSPESATEVDEAPEEGPASTTSTADTTDGAQGRWTPEDLQSASAFAVQFAHDYLNYDQAQPGIRERELRAYLAPGLDPQLGWNGQGTQLAVLTVPIEITTDDDRVAVTVAAQVTGQDAPRWVHLAVPLARDDQLRWAVIAQPAYVPRPPAGNPAAAEVAEIDQVLSNQLTAAMGDLFQAYATEASVAIGGVTAPGATIRGLQGQFAFVDVDAVRIAAGDDTGREGTVNVTWNDPVTGGALTQDYDITLTIADGIWLVEEVRTG